MNPLAYSSGVRFVAILNYSLHSSYKRAGDALFEKKWFKAFHSKYNLLKIGIRRGEEW